MPESHPWKLILAVLVAGVAAAPTPSAAADPGGASIALYGGYSGWWDHAQVKAYALRQLGTGEIVGEPIGSTGVNGAAATGQLEAVARYTMVTEWYGVRPTVALAYREIVGHDSEKSDPAVVMDSISYRSDVERTLLRSVGLELGGEIGLGALFDGLRLRAFLGPDCSEYRHLLRSYGLALPNGTTIDRRWFPGLRSGFELTAPLDVDLLGGVSLGLRTVYTRYFGDPNRIEVNVPLFDEHFRYAHRRRSKAKPQESLSVQLGIELHRD